MPQTQNLAERVEQLERERDDLEARLKEAARAAEEATNKLRAVDAEKDALSSRVFAGEPAAMEEYKRGVQEPRGVRA